MIEGGLFANQKFDKVETLNKKTPVSISNKYCGHDWLMTTI